MKAFAFVLICLVLANQRGASLTLQAIEERPQRPSNGLFENPFESVYEPISKESSEEGDDFGLGTRQNNESDEMWSSLLGSNGFPARTGRTDRLRKLMQRLFGDRTASAEWPGLSSSEAVDHSRPSWFSSAFFANAKPWWKGPNVCEKLENHDEDIAANASSTSDIESQTSMIRTLIRSCQETDRSYKCTTRIRKGGKTLVKTQTFECCLGFERESESAFGCNKQLQLQDLSATLQKLNLTDFLDAAKSINLLEKLTTQNLTLFVPTNEAMNKASDSHNNDITAVVSGTNDRMQFVRDVLLSHVIDGWKHSDEFSDEELAKTENGSPLRINYFSYPKLMTANCASVTSPDNQAINGLIHVVDRMIIPASQSLMDILNNDPKLSVMRSLINTEMQQKLQDSNGHYTLLAFTDNAFEALPTSTKDKIRNGNECFRGLVREHILEHTICSAAVPIDAAIRNFAGRYLRMQRVSDDVLTVENATASVVDKVASNGVVHVIDKVLLSDRMLGGLAGAEKDNGKAFVELIRTNVPDLEAHLNEAAENVTIFIPIDEAVKSLSGSIRADKNNLKRTLRNHIVKGLIEITPQTGDTLMHTIDDKPLSLNVTRLNVIGFSTLFYGPLKASVQCANVIRANKQACSSIIHYIDKVLVNPTKNAMELLRENPNVSQFVLFIEAAELEGILSDANFKGTVLAPTNDALQARLSASEIENLLSDKVKVGAFVKKHFLTESVCCNAVTGDAWSSKRFNTMVGTALLGSGSNPGGAKSIGSAIIQTCDQIATNGIVHLIDRPVSQRRRSSSVFDGSTLAGNENWGFNWFQQ